MTYYAVIGRIPFDDEDSIMFYESDDPTRRSLSGSSVTCLKNPIARTKRKYVNSAVATMRSSSRTSCRLRLSWVIHDSPPHPHQELARTLLLPA